MPIPQPTTRMPIPQYNQMASCPQFPKQNPLIQYNPLVNPLHNITGQKRTTQDVIYDRAHIKEFKNKKKKKKKYNKE